MKRGLVLEGKRGTYQKKKRTPTLMDQENNIINSKRTSRGNTIPNFKVYHCAIVMKYHKVVS